MENKPWYQSKTVWAGVVTVLLVLYDAIQVNLGVKWPNIPEYVYAILGALGIHGRVTAKTAIK